VKSLTDIDFIINLYDPCVANKIIEGEQMTICFHVDDCKLSHRKKTIMDRMIGYLWQEYESIFKDESGAMTVSRGKIHKYLGMTLDYSAAGKVKIIMFDYVNDILAAFDKAKPRNGGTKASAAPAILFKVDEDCEKIAQAKAVEFYNMVEKTFYVTRRARPDICTKITFLKYD
jgi:hypothetical protein